MRTTGTSQQIIKAFVNGYNKPTRNSTGTLYRGDNDTIYSYGKHFPLLMRTKQGFVMNSDIYSMSTGLQQNKVRSVADLQIKLNILKQIIEDYKWMDQRVNEKYWMGSRYNTQERTQLVLDKARIKNLETDGYQDDEFIFYYGKREILFSNHSTNGGWVRYNYAYEPKTGKIWVDGNKRTLTNKYITKKAQERWEEVQGTIDGIDYLDYSR